MGILGRLLPKATHQQEYPVGNRADNLTRHERYERILRAAQAMHVFELGQLQKGCKPEVPGYVTHVANELVKDGVLKKGAKAPAIVSQSEDSPTRLRFTVDRLQDQRHSNQTGLGFGSTAGEASGPRVVGANDGGIARHPGSLRTIGRIGGSGGDEDRQSIQQANASARRCGTR